MQNQIPKNWRKVKLGDVAILNPSVTITKGEHSYIPMEDLDWNQKYVSSRLIKEFKGGAKFEEGDVLFARITPCLENGKIGRARNLIDSKGFGSTEYFVIRGKENITDTDYLYYLCRTYRLRQTAINSMLGASGRQRADIESLQNFELNLPTYSEQKIITSILTTFDDKIEVNNKIAKTLEEMAQAIFKESFVHFRLPGYEKAEFVDSKLGKIPRGWHIGKLEDLCEKLGSGGTPRTNNEKFYNGDIDWFSTKELNDGFLLNSEKKISNEGLNNSSAKMFPAGSVVMAIYAAPTVGRLGILSKEAAFNQAACGFYANKALACNEFIYLFLLSSRIRLNNLAGGVAQQNLNVGIVKNFPVIIPDTKTIFKFKLIIQPIFDKILRKSVENQKLAALRDLLLPKLMRGEIRV